MEARFWNGSRIFLRHCFTSADMYNYQGAEIHLLLVNELSHFTAEIYTFLRSRVRYVTASERWKHLYRVFLEGDWSGVCRLDVQRIVEPRKACN